MKKSLFFSLLLGIMTQAQLTSINENFTNFTSGAGSIPQNGWSSDKPYPYSLVYQTQSGNKYLTAYSFTGVEYVYLIAPELVSVEGKLAFRIGGNLGGTVEVGLVSNPTDMSSFEKIYERNIPSQLTRTQVDLTQNTKKFIAFKFLPVFEHSTMGIDDITFTPTQLSVNESEKSVTLSEVIFDSNTRKLISLNHQLKSVQIINAAGQKVAEIKSPKKEEDVHLTTGVYVVIYENAQGEKRTTKIRVN